MLTGISVSQLALIDGAGVSLYLAWETPPFRMWSRWAADRLVKNKSSISQKKHPETYCLIEAKINLCSLSHIFMLMAAKEKLRTVQFK